MFPFSSVPTTNSQNTDTGRLSGAIRTAGPREDEHWTGESAADFLNEVDGRKGNRSGPRGEAPVNPTQTQGDTDASSSKPETEAVAPPAAGVVVETSAPSKQQEAVGGDQLHARALISKEVPSNRSPSPEDLQSAASSREESADRSKPISTLDGLDAANGQNALAAIISQAEPAQDGSAILKLKPGPEPISAATVKGDHVTFATSEGIDGQGLSPRVAAKLVNASLPNNGAIPRTQDTAELEIDTATAENRLERRNFDALQGFPQSTQRSSTLSYGDMKLFQDGSQSLTPSNFTPEVDRSGSSAGEQQIASKQELIVPDEKLETRDVAWSIERTSTRDDTHALISSRSKSISEPRELPADRQSIEQPTKMATVSSEVTGQSQKSTDSTPEIRNRESLPKIAVQGNNLSPDASPPEQRPALHQAEISVAPHRLGSQAHWDSGGPSTRFPSFEGAGFRASFPEPTTAAMLTDLTQPNRQSAKALETVSTRFEYKITSWTPGGLTEQAATLDRTVSAGVSPATSTLEIPAENADPAKRNTRGGFEDLPLQTASHTKNELSPTTSDQPVLAKMNAEDRHVSYRPATIIEPSAEPATAKLSTSAHPEKIANDTSKASSRREDITPAQSQPQAPQVTGGTPAIAFGPAQLEPKAEASEAMSLRDAQTDISTRHEAHATGKTSDIGSDTKRSAALVAQLRAQIPQLPGQTTEILLHPEELGRVRMTLSGQDGTGTVVMQIERPETLELIRRNLDLMRADLNEAGWQQVDFRFGQDMSQGDRGDSSDQSAAETTIPQSSADIEANGGTIEQLSDATNNSVSGLDLRL